MTAITEEITEEAIDEQRPAAETPAATAGVPSPRAGRTATVPVKQEPVKQAPVKQAPVTPVSGIVDITDGRGYLRTAGYRRSPGDIPLTSGQIRQYGLRQGDQIDAFVTGKGNGATPGVDEMRPYDNGTRRQQVTFSMDCIVHF